MHRFPLAVWWESQNHIAEVWVGLYLYILNEPQLIPLMVSPLEGKQLSYIWQLQSEAVFL